MADVTFTQASLMDILVEASGLPEGDRSMEPADSFGDVGLDSLAFLQLQAELSQRYGFEMPDERAECTFGEIVAVVAEFLGAQLPAAGHGALVTEGAGA
jgi:acyl carrier protein